MTDLLVVGGGLAGLFAANLAAEQGASVMLVSQGRGGLSLSHGGIAVLDRAKPLRAFPRLPEHHPYRLAGKHALKQAASTFARWMQAAGLPYRGRLSASTQILLASGRTTRISLAPPSLGAPRGRTLGVGAIDGFRDFPCHLLTTGLREEQRLRARVVPLPFLRPSRELYATDIAACFEDAARRAEMLRLWKPAVRGLDMLILPAVIGLEDHAERFDEVQNFLECDVLEVPTLPPSLPGLRLERALRQRALRNGVRFIEGSRAIGRVDGRSGGRRASGIQVITAGGPRTLKASAILLATGGVLHGGVVAAQTARVRESVFGLPLTTPQERSDWTRPSPFSRQPYSNFGVRVDSRMQVLDPSGDPIFANLYAAGGILAGSDRVWEGSRQGIDLATAYRAVESFLEDRHH